ncbi:MAG: glycosyltransferase, partial [Acidobacteriota bacterium]
MKVTNGLDLSRFRAAPVASGLVEGKSSGAGASSLPLILGVGRLVEKKGFVGLMEACSLLKDRGVLFRCRIIGEGPERGRLEALISRRQLEPFCRLEGARTQEVVHRSLMEATVLAAPCVTLSSGDKDGLPTVILEAMAQGTPVVSTPVAAIPEIVEDHRTGLLVPEQDPSALAGRLESLLVHPRRCRRLARAARLALMERHDV